MNTRLQAALSLLLFFLMSASAGAPPIPRFRPKPPTPRIRVEPTIPYEPPISHPRGLEIPSDWRNTAPELRDIIKRVEGKTIVEGEQSVADYYRSCCPRTSEMLDSFPIDMRVQVLERLNRASKTTPMYLPGTLPIKWRELRLDADVHALNALKRVALSSFITADLHLALMALGDAEFTRVLTVIGKSTELEQSIAALPPELRTPAVARVSASLRTSRAKVRELVSEFQQLKLAIDSGAWAANTPATLSGIDGAILAIGNDPKPGRVPFVTARGGSLNFGEAKVPRWELLGVERGVAARDFKSLLGNPSPDEPVLFLRGDYKNSTHLLLPNHLTARTFDGSGRFAKIHLDNLQSLAERRIEPERTVLFNLIPESRETIKQLGLKGGEKRWRQAKRSYDEFADKNNVRLGDGKNKEHLLDVLDKGEQDVIVIVAHGEKGALYLADGSMISVQDILNLGPLQTARKPVVFLVACETGKFDGAMRSIAQALLLQGRASAVLAPTEKVPALGPTIEFVTSLLCNGSVPAREALKQLRAPWQVYVELTKAPEVLIPPQKENEQVRST